MRRVGIICEYNPFHAGHAHLIETVRAAGACEVVCAMSGNFTQRGEAAILPPVPRAAMAIAGGADLVVELPFPAAASSARYFATAGVRTLAALGVDTVAFGSECADTGRLSALAEKTMEADFAAVRRGGGGSAATYFEALGGPLAPNDILAVEYTRAVRTEKLPLALFPVPRAGAGYHDTALDGAGFPSAAALRAKVYAGEDVTPLLPSAVREIWQKALGTYGAADIAALGTAYLAHLRARPDGTAAECGAGLATHLSRAAQRAADYETLLAAAATKQYTNARLRRAMLFSLAGVRQSDLEAPFPYLRLLGANEAGRAILAGGTAVPVLSRQGEIAALGVPAARARELARISDGLFALAAYGRVSVHALQTAKPCFR